MRSFGPRAAALAFIATTISACGLPGSGPGGNAILEQATTSLEIAPEADSRKFVVLDVAARVASGAPEPSFGSFSSTFGAVARRLGRPDITFGIGDNVQITVFEAQKGGLFIDQDAGSRPGNFVQLPAQQVDRAGNIKVPYAGAIQVVGRTPASVQTEIEQKLSQRAIEPQVFITTLTQRGSEVAVLGDVNSASKFPVNPAGERVTDVISRAGGIKSLGFETFVTLQRGGQTAKISFERLVRAPAENVFVRPGDTVYVSKEAPSYTVLGATVLNNRVAFPTERVTLAEALGTGNGLAPLRAGPRYVYLYRTEPAHLLSRVGVDLSQFEPRRAPVPTIYKANLDDPAALFAAQQFAIRDKDVIYVAESDSVELVKLFAVFTAITSPAAQAASGIYNINRFQ